MEIKDLEHGLDELFTETINGIKYSTSGVKTDNNEIYMNCTFKQMDKDGNYQRCQNRVLKTNIDKNNNNNNYCVSHQEFVNKINRDRSKDATNKLKENIIAWINLVEQPVPDNDENLRGFMIDTRSFLKKLNRGDFEK